MHTNCNGCGPGESRDTYTLPYGEKSDQKGWGGGKEKKESVSRTRPSYSCIRIYIYIYTRGSCPLYFGPPQRAIRETLTLTLGPLKFVKWILTLIYTRGLMCEWKKREHERERGGANTYRAGCYKYIKHIIFVLVICEKIDDAFIWMVHSRKP